MSSNTRAKTTRRSSTSSDVLFSRTGNPFVDSGLAALCTLAGRGVPEDITPEDVRTQLAYIVRLYSHADWRSAIHGMIFPNADLVNYGLKDGPERYERAMNTLLEQVGSVDGHGSCVACGRRDGVQVDKTRVPLLGSQKLVNYFPAGSGGERFCPNCILASQFLMLAVEKVGIPLMLHCSSWPIQLAYAGRIVDRARTNYGKKKGGLVTLGYKMPAGLNAVYDAITTIIQDKKIGVTEDADLAVPLRFYHFTNYGQGPQVNTYDIPSVVFQFLIEVQKSRSWDAWRRIVGRGIVARGKKKLTEEELSKSIPNQVYVNLTKGESILSYFINDDHSVIGDWSLISLYLRKVRGMSENRIETIKKVADSLLEFARSSGSARRIRDIELARNYNDFRTALVKVQAEMARKEGKGLLTYDEYTLDIAPEGGATWRETRDLILFRVFEEGASWLAGVSEEVSPEESKEEEEQ